MKKVVGCGIALIFGTSFLFSGCGNSEPQIGKKSKDDAIEAYVKANTQCDEELMLSLVPDSCRSYIEDTYYTDNEKLKEKVKDNLISVRNGSVLDYDVEISSEKEDKDTNDWLNDFLVDFGFTGKVVESYYVTLTIKVDREAAKEHFGGKTVNYLYDHIFQCDDEQWYSYMATSFAAVDELRDTLPNSV